MSQETGRVSVPIQSDLWTSHPPWPREPFSPLSVSKRICQNGIFPCLYDHVLLGFDLDTVKMLMNMFVSYHPHQTKMTLTKV